MLAHLKAKGRSLAQGAAAASEKKSCKEEGTSGFQQTNNNAQQQQQQSKQQQPQRRDSSHLYENEATQMTCEMLCSLSSSCSPPAATSKASVSANGYSSCRGAFDCSPSPSTSSSMMFSVAGTAATAAEKRNSGTSSSLGCSKQHQLPMFLSKTYHMIDRCDGTIATWSESGDNFVVKNVEKFASAVLPLYFKHSNFSSFARQLNFYGFRKLRTDPILTSDVDPRTACYVRFYHEKFQKDRPELLHQIKRATKSDQQSKDDVESLKAEVSRLKECMSQWQTDTDRKLTELAYENNRRITCLSAEYDKLAAVVQELLATVASGTQGTTTTTAGIIKSNSSNGCCSSSSNSSSSMNASSIRHNAVTTEHEGSSTTSNAAAASLMDHVQHSEKTFAMMNPPPPPIASSNMEGSMPAPTGTPSSSLLSMAVSLQQKPQQHSKAPRQYQQQPPLPQQQKPQQKRHDLMHSLSTVAAMSLQQNHHPLRPQGDVRSALGKRGAEDETPSEHIPIHSRARND